MKWTTHDLIILTATAGLLFSPPSLSSQEQEKTSSPTASLLNEGTKQEHKENKSNSPTASLLEETSEEGGSSFDQICSSSEGELNSKMIQGLCHKIQELQGKIDDLESSQNSLSNSIDAITDAPPEDLRVLGNFIMTGTGYTYYTAPVHENGTFGTIIDPVMLWRYGDNLLFEMKLDIALADCDTNIQLVYGTLDYVVNDWLTVRVGKYSTPLGFVWEKMTTGWINKLPNLPLPYNPRRLALTPAAETGIDIRGAVPFHNVYFDCERKIPFVLDYDIWVGNGPDENNGRIRLGCNYNDNNHNIAFGSRVGLRFEPYKEIGLSGEWGQWNNNNHTALVTSKKHLFYKAVVLDLHWRIKELVDILGECMYTSYGAVPNKKLGIHKRDVKQIGGWIQFASYFSWLYTNCCLKDSIWDNFEGVLRYGFVNSGITEFSGQQWTAGVNYHFSNMVILKTAYDLNLEDRIRNNTFTVQLAYAY